LYRRRISQNHSFKKEILRKGVVGFTFE